MVYFQSLGRLFRKTCVSKYPNIRKMSTDFPANAVNRLLWFDAEMTGLDVERCQLIEVACIVTDESLKIIAEGPSIVINQPKEILDNMDNWCLNSHTKSGLYQACIESKISLREAEKQLLSFVRPLLPKGQCSIAGNSVYMDVLFLKKYMPEFMEHFHYRLLDVSSFKLASRLWYGSEYTDKVFRHRALDDIKESIQELEYYRRNIFK